MTSLQRPTDALTESLPSSRTSAVSTIHWRVAGGLYLGHVALLFGAISQEALLERGASPDTVGKVYGTANLSRVFTGGYLEALSFLVLAAALVLIARVVGRRTEAGRAAAQIFLVLGVAYIASTLAVGFAPGAAAAYWSQHGGDLGAAAMVNDIRNYAFILQIAMEAGMVIALAVALLAGRVVARWLGWLGLVVGVAAIVATPFAHNAVDMALRVWFLTLAVLVLRGPRTTRRSS